MKQTAVKWLELKIKKFNTVITREYLLLLTKQALELENQQIIDAWIDAEGYNDGNAIQLAEQYYNETYKTKSE